MKNKLTKVFLTAFVALAGVLTSCTKEGYGEFSLTIKETGADYVDIFVTAPEATEIAYLLTDEPQLITPAVLFKTGTLRTVKPADLWRIDYGIFQGRKYYLYAAAKEGDGYKRVELQFTTKEYDFTEMVSLARSYYNGFMVHITVPQEVKDRGNVIRYGSTSLAWYNLLKSQKGGDALDLNAIAANGDSFSGYIEDDATIIMDDSNVILMDEEGNPVLDENGQQIDIHDPIAPNEPTIFLAGECRWGTPDEYAAVMGFYKEQKKDAPNVPLYDVRTQKWTGAFQKIEFFTKAPDQGEATVEIEIPEDEITVTDANIYFTMKGNVDRYFYMVLDNSTYNQILAVYLDGNEDWFQWFLTSYIAFYEWGVYPVSENLSINAASSFVEPLTGGETYHVIANVFEKGEDGDQDFVTGSKQNFVHTTFKAKEKTKPAPVIEVTKVDTGDPFQVAFNIKAGKDSQGNVQPVMGAYWVCNYAREFEYMFNLKYTYATLLKGNGNVFSSADIAAINSEKGLTYEFPTLDGETTRMAVYGCNDEYTFNLIDETNFTAGWADYAAPYADNADKIESPLYEKLAGEWTATATITAKVQNEDESIVSYDKTHSSKVVISYAAPELPEQVEEDVYPNYASKFTKEQVDAMFNDLVDLHEIFTESRIVGQNRLLCTGFIDFDYYNGDPYPNRLKTRTPYDLFKATDYVSIDVAELMYDFGPKWFLQVQEDGSVVVPFHSEQLPTLAAWPGYPFYVGGYAEGVGVFLDSNSDYPGFPVEISDDYNTITIKPIVLSDGKTSIPYYMNACGLQTGSTDVEIIAPVKSDIVLTRGWTDPELETPAVSAAPAKAQLRNMDGSPAAAPVRKSVVRSMTRFDHEPLPEYRQEEKPNLITMDMVNESIEKALKRFNLK